MKDDRLSAVQGSSLTEKVLSGSVSSTFPFQTIVVPWILPIATWSPPTAGGSDLDLREIETCLWATRPGASLGIRALESASTMKLTAQPSNALA